MEGALWILLVLVVVGVCLYVGDRISARKNQKEVGVNQKESGVNDDANAKDDEGECCGLHLVCEKDSLSPMSADVVYYDDEELDRFIGRDENSYSAEEVEEFRDVLMTLRPEDVAGWARSVTQRRLPLPPDVRDELLMLVNEQRNTK